MTFEELWKMIEEKNPQLQSGKVAMSSDSFKKALQLAWDQGAKQQKDVDKCWMDMMKNSYGNGGNSKGFADAGGLFGQIFGNKQ